MASETRDHLEVLSGSWAGMTYLEHLHVASLCSMASHSMTSDFPEGWGIRDPRGGFSFGPQVAALEGFGEPSDCLGFENPDSSIFTSCQTGHHNLPCKVLVHMFEPAWGHFSLFICVDP